MDVPVGETLEDAREGRRDAGVEGVTKAGELESAGP